MGGGDCGLGRKLGSRINPEAIDKCLCDMYTFFDITTPLSKTDGRLGHKLREEIELSIFW